MSTITSAFRRVEIESNTLPWLQWRRGGLGASDAPGVLGLSPYTSPRDVWLSKVSDLVTDEQTEAMEFGHVLEPVIIGQVAKRHGDPDNDRHRYLGQIVEGAVVESVEHPHLRASFDAMVVEADGRAYPLNAKNVSPYRSRSFDDAELGMPDDIAVQLYHEAIVAGVDHAYVAPFFGNRLPEPTRIDVPADYRDWYIETSAAWWANHVTAKVEPEPTLLDDLASVWNAIPGSEVDFDDEQRLTIDELHDVRAKLKLLDTRKDELELLLKIALGEATEGFVGVGELRRLAITWRPNKQPREKFYRDELLADHPELSDLLTSYTRRDGALPRPFLVK